jgi:hypothetical protein
MRENEDGSETHRGIRGLDADGIALRIVRMQRDDDILRFARDEIDSNVVGHERKTAAAAVDEDGELHLGWAAVIEKLVERRFYRAPRKEHIIDEDHGGAVNIGRNLGGGEFLGYRMAADVIPVERNIQRACARAEFLGQPSGELHPAIGNPEQQQPGRIRVAGGDGITQPRNRSLDLRRTDRLRSGHRGWL